MRVPKAILGLLLGIGLAGGLMSGCDSACKDIDHTAINPQCQSFNGFEPVHFDSANQFETFLIHRCEAPAEVQDDILAEVDFSQEVVMCASGPLNDPELGCLRSREVSSVASCIDGVQFIYEDMPKENAAFCTTQMWFICERLPRDEARAAWGPLLGPETIGF